MKSRRAAIGILVAILSVLLGVNQDRIMDFIDRLDPPPAGLARVEEVIDGDTILVRFGESKERVRFIGVDTPETNHPDKAVQCFGKAATLYLKDWIEGENVRLEMDPTNTNRDRYDRLLRYVYTDDGQLTNVEIIRQGYGFAYTAFPFQKMDEFVSAQNEARSQERGLWSACDIKEDGEFFNSGPDLDDR